ncbi:hypothetical protein HAZT_HAZT005002, partial [Hyalella azteca]
MHKLILHMAIADIFVTLACLLVETIWTYTVEWLAGDFLCKLAKYLQMFSLYASTFVLVLVGLDRLVAVRFPMQRAKTLSYCDAAVFIAYVTAAVLSIPQARNDLLQSSLMAESELNIRGNDNKQQDGQGGNRQRLIKRAKSKALRMSVIIVLAFLICWTPYYYMMILHVFGDSKDQGSEVLVSTLPVN